MSKLAWHEESPDWLPFFAAALPQVKRRGRGTFHAMVSRDKARLHERECGSSCTGYRAQIPPDGHKAVRKVGKAGLGLALIESVLGNLVASARSPVCKLPL